jgi:cobalt-zinc-cadmium efflux system protein
MEPCGHNHIPAHEHAGAAALEPSRRKLLFAVALTAVVLVAEVAGGIWAHSLALLSDAAHVFTDLISLALSLGALVIAARPVSKEHTFGFHRAEVFAALANGVLLLLIAAGILHAAYERILHPPTVNVQGMLAVAVAGLVANAVIVVNLRGHAHRDLNIRSAYLHVLADLGGSVGVVIAGVVIWLSGWQRADPIIGIAIALAVLVGSVRLLRDTAHILLEGVPRGITLDAVAKAVQSVPGVEGIHDLHIWTICSNLLALSVHVTVGSRTAEQRDVIVQEINDRLRQQFGIEETTVQAEAEPCRTEDLVHVVPHNGQ